MQNSVRGELDGLGVAYELLDYDPDFADTAAFCQRYGFAPEDSANTILVGFGLPDELPLYVNEQVLAREHIILGGGDRSSKVRGSPEVFWRMARARIVSGLAVEPVPPSE